MKLTIFADRRIIDLAHFEGLSVMEACGYDALVAHGPQVSTVVAFFAKGEGSDAHAALAIRACAKALSEGLVQERPGYIELVNCLPPQDDWQREVKERIEGGCECDEGSDAGPGMAESGSAPVTILTALRIRPDGLGDLTEQLVNRRVEEVLLHGSGVVQLVLGE